jgi:hypothetical protein
MREGKNFIKDIALGLNLQLEELLVRIECSILMLEEMSGPTGQKRCL